VTPWAEDRTARLGRRVMILSSLVLAAAAVLVCLSFWQRGAVSAPWLWPLSPASSLSFLLVIFGLPLAFILTQRSLSKLAPGADPLLFPLACLLTVWGVALLFRLSPDLAAQRPGQGLGLLATKQVLFVLFGLVVMLGAVRLVTWQFLARLARMKYVYVLAAVGLIALTGLFGLEINGRRLWLRIGPLTIQTVELVKILLVLFVAGYFGSEDRYLGLKRVWLFQVPRSLRPVGAFAAMAFLSLLPLILQRDLGPVVLLTGLYLVVFYLATGSLTLVMLGLAVMVAGGLAAYHLEWPAVVARRVEMWLDPFSYSEGYARAVWSLSAGGWLGRGLGFGQAYTIPEVQSDFSFTAICEETGLVGGAILLVCYAAFLARGFGVARRLAGTYGGYLAAGLTAMFGVQALVIVAGNIGLLPLTGVTLPFVSFGGSSLLISFLSLGILIKLSSKGAGLEGAGASGSALGQGRDG